MCSLGYNKWSAKNTYPNLITGIAGFLPKSALFIILFCIKGCVYRRNKSGKVQSKQFDGVGLPNRYSTECGLPEILKFDKRNIITVIYWL
jgi:hypothetical protein